MDNQCSETTLITACVDLCPYSIQTFNSLAIFIQGSRWNGRFHSANSIFLVNILIGQWQTWAIYFKWWLLITFLGVVFCYGYDVCVGVSESKFCILWVFRGWDSTPSTINQLPQQLHSSSLQLPWVLKFRRIITIRSREDVWVETFCQRSSIHDRTSLS